MIFNHRVRSSKSASGFTLIELLVVVAIIALLAAILFPVFGRARENARRSSCQSNLKQIGLGLEQYKNDYDGWLAPVQTAPPSQRGWPTLLDPYLKSAQIYNCPSAERPGVAPDATLLSPTLGTARAYCGLVTGDQSASGTSIITQPNLSYSWNAITDRDDAWEVPTWGRYAGSSTNPTLASGTRLEKSGFITLGERSPLQEAAIGDASGTIQIVDGIAGANTDPGTATPCQASALVRIDTQLKTDHYPDRVTTKPAYRHFGGFNALFGDGHVKWRRWGSTRPSEWTIQDD